VQSAAVKAKQRFQADECKLSVRTGSPNKLNEKCSGMISFFEMLSIFCPNGVLPIGDYKLKDW
jgi:hypothetical protein